MAEPEPELEPEPVDIYIYAYTYIHRYCSYELTLVVVVRFGVLKHQMCSQRGPTQMDCSPRDLTKAECLAEGS